MRREQRAAVGHPDRTAEMVAVLDELDAVPIEYAGTVRFVGMEHRVITRATLDALIAAASRVRTVLGTLAECRQGHGGRICRECAGMYAAWWRWRRRNLVEGGPEWFADEPHVAMSSMLHSGKWPENYVREWQYWADRLPTAGTAPPRRGARPRG